jgi:hypothetical protein
MKTNRLHSVGAVAGSALLELSQGPPCWSFFQLFPLSRLHSRSLNAALIGATLSARPERLASSSCRWWPRAVTHPTTPGSRQFASTPKHAS